MFNKILKTVLVLLVCLFFEGSGLAAQSPQRIISLAPSITEILFALGLGKKIVGVTVFCDRPPQAKKKPKIGGMTNPSLEKILRLKPDLVILSIDGNPRDVYQKLQSLKIKTYVFKARRIFELPQAIRELGKVLSVEHQAGLLAEQIERAIDKYKVNIHPHKRKKAIFIIWPEPLIVAGPNTAIDDAMQLVGLVNIAHDAKVRYPKYSLEELVRRNPDVIFIGKGHVEMKKISSNLLKKLKMVKAVRDGRVYFVSDALYRLGPRIIKGIKEMAGYQK